MKISLRKRHIRYFESVARSARGRARTYIHIYTRTHTYMRADTIVFVARARARTRSLKSHRQELGLAFPFFEPYEKSGAHVHTRTIIHTLGPSLENRFSRRSWITKRRGMTMWYWLHVVWFDRDRYFQLWSCDSASYLLPRESLGAWACDSWTVYDLLPPRLRTSSNAPSSRRLK